MALLLLLGNTVHFICGVQLIPLMTILHILSLYVDSVVVAKGMTTACWECFRITNFDILFRSWLGEN